MIDGHRGRADDASELDELDPTDSLEVSEAAPEHEAPAGATERGRAGIRHTLHAIGPRFVAMGVKADYVTVLGILVAGVTGAVLGLGHLFLAAVLLTVGGLMDTLDGAVAKAAGTSSKRGAFFDSVSDRIADMFIFGGLAWYFAVGPGHDPKLSLIAFAILGVSNTISYERAKAESLGYVAKGGLMERAERLILLGVALVLDFVLVPLLFVLLGLCIVTACQRFFKVWRLASRPAGETTAPAIIAGALSGVGGVLSRRPARVESRWRAWRDATATSATTRGRVTVVSRARSRRRDEPLSIRLRQAFQTERTGTRTTTRTATGSGRARSERRRQGAESSFRRRLGR
jgi:CDP-diacylglycerol--glycerol-3-phosphate 3-phosphatidyltransferase